VALASTSGASAPGQSLSLANRFAEFSGGLSSYALGAARRAQPTIRAHEQQVYEIDVPAGSASLLARVSKPSDAGADLDVYVYDCSGKECRAAGAGADPLVADGPRDEVVMIQNPAAGKWKIVVDAAAVPSGSTRYDYVDVVFNQAFGMVAATDRPATRSSGAQWSASTHVWAAALPDGRVPYPALLVEGRASATERFMIGLVSLSADGRVAEK
jgi:hypothetical protein